MGTDRCSPVLTPRCTYQRQEAINKGISESKLTHCILTMQVNNHFKPVVLSPSDRFLKVRQLSLNVRLARRDFEGPVSDGDANVIEPANLSVQETKLNATLHYPAAAICAMSFSVIQVFQWLVRTLVASVRSTNCPKVHSSMTRESPVLSKIEGVIHG